MKLEVGKTYYDPDEDAKCTITEHDPSDNTYLSDTGYWFHDDGRFLGYDYHLQPTDEPAAQQTRPITFLSAVDALAEEHGLTVTECSVSEGVYTLVVVGE